MELSRALYLGLVLLVATQRIAELARSRRHLTALARNARTPEREPAYVAMVLVHTLTLVAAPLEVVLAKRGFSPVIGLPALALLLLAQLGRVWVFRTLRSAWNVRVVRPLAVITTGPYRYVRHPNYLLVCIELVALPLVHSAWMTALGASFANALVLMRRIALEESVLAQDPAWTRAFERVPRLIPRIISPAKPHAE